jgi:phosphoribosylformylglycinamidine (FGAM) synthase PurS component
VAWVVGVGYREGSADPLGMNVRKDIEDLRIGSVRGVKTLQTYVISGNATKEEMENVCRELFSDGMVQFYNFDTFREDGSHLKKLVKDRGVWVAEVRFKPGVMDPVGLSSERAIKILGVNVDSVHTGTAFVIDGDLSEKEMEAVCRKSLANGMIQTFSFRRIE